jgi:hypothetical protein
LRNVVGFEIMPFLIGQKGFLLSSRKLMIRSGPGRIGCQENNVARQRL